MSKNTRALVEVKDLKKHFEVKDGAFSKKTLKALDGISFSIKKGETLGLVGESGSGKTTAGRTLLYLYTPTSGEVIFDGKKIETREDIALLRQKSSYVFQDPYSSLNPRMTVADIIGEPLDVHSLYGSLGERREKILSLMERVGLNSEQATRYAHEFSGGQRQRIGIARALATNPDFLVCDEPVSALDVSIQAQIINMFEAIREELSLTYLFIAHDLLIVRHVSDRIAVMYLGEIVELADADTIYTYPLHPYTKALISAIPIPDPKTAKNGRRINLEGEIPSPINKPSGCPFRTRCPAASDVCIEEKPKLREFYRNHYVACHRVEELLK